MQRIEYHCSFLGNKLKEGDIATFSSFVRICQLCNPDDKILRFDKI